MIPLVDLKRQYQSIKSEIDAAIQDILDRTAFVGGAGLKKFEQDFADLTGAKYGIGVASGTTALWISLLALGIGEGDEVITVPNTFIATTEAITQVGAKVKFVDVDEETYNMNVSQLEAAITDKTKAVIPVHLYGQPVDINEIDAIAKKHGLKVIYDACQSHLAEYKGQPIGKFGDAVCYSFYPGKNLGAYGDGGMITTNDKALAEKMAMLIDHGRMAGKKYEHDMEGYNCRLDSLQAAILDVKLKHIANWTKGRQNAADMYNAHLKDVGIGLPKALEDRSHVYHLFVVRTDNRDEVKQFLNDNGIGAGIHYPIPLHLQKAYEYLGHKEGDFPVSEKGALGILSLPMFPELTEDDVKEVVSLLKKAIESTNKETVNNV